MSPITIKTIIASLFLVAGTAAFLTMMTLMGRTERKADPVKLRKAHKAAGYAFVVLLVPLLYFGAGFVRDMGDELSARGVFHLVLAVSLISILFLKVLVIRFFRLFTKHAPALGMTLFTLTLVIFLITAGFVFLRGSSG
jgi:hypothetical protein